MNANTRITIAESSSWLYTVISSHLPTQQITCTDRLLHKVMAKKFNRLPTPQKQRKFAQKGSWIHKFSGKFILGTFTAMQAVMRSSIYEIFHTLYGFNIPHGLIRTHKWPALNVSGFIARLVRASHQYRKVTASNPVEVLSFSGFHIHNCINCVNNCKDHSLLDTVSMLSKLKYVREFSCFVSFNLNCHITCTSLQGGPCVT